MPKIKVTSIEIAGRMNPVELWYKSKQGFYFKPVPPEIITVDTNNVFHYGGGFTTENNALEALKEFARLYEQSAQKVKLVLVVYSSIGSRTKDELHQKGIKWAYNKAFTRFGASVPGYGFSFKFEVMKEMKVGDSIQYFTSNISRPKNIEDYKFKTHVDPDSVTIVDYSEEREAALLDAQQRINLLAEKVLGVLVDPEKVLLLGSNRLLE